MRSQSEPTNALPVQPQPPLQAMQRAHGRLLLMFLLVVVLAAGWDIFPGKRPQGLPPEAKAHTLAELVALPGAPENAPSARPKAIGYDAARKLNAAIAFTPRADRPAPPFRFVGSLADRTRAVDCLAIAAMAEAGADDDGQRAVIQVVLNRVRHPAFAKTVCGVVFEGSHRTTGCQFTFTCDGALARRHSATSWTRARERAMQALDGRVYAPVGLATHYHTDWVHPYWSASLIKLARVDTHLFFRWPGYWGKATVLSIPYRGGEPAIRQLSYLPGHGDGAQTPASQLASQITSDTASGELIVRNEDGGAFVLLSGAASARSARELGRNICMGRPFCKVFGWFDRATIPREYPVPANSRARLAFSYFRDAQNGEVVLYDCARFAGVTADGCIPASVARRSTLREKAKLSPVGLKSLRAAHGKDGPSPPSGDVHQVGAWREGAMNSLR
jgi:hypothetical protein